LDKLAIEGGIPLSGEVSVSGAKNAALPILAACCLTGGEHRLENVPRLWDVDTMRRLLGKLGVEAQWEGETTLRVDSSQLAGHEAPYDLVKTMRASVLVLGPLLARLGRAKISLPGGCAIGVRPIHLHLKALHQLGAQIHLEHGYVEATARRLKGTTIYFDIPTVTGTENLMMTAALAQGVTVLENAACEPEVIDLATMLGKMGVAIQGAGTRTITIEGVKELKPVQHTIIPDRIEAGTLMVAAAITGGDVVIRNCPLENLEAVNRKLTEVGCQITLEEKGCVRVRADRHIRNTDITTLPYPGFPTDMQAQMMALMALGKGVSVISETIFENRFIHVPELRRLGADIQIQGNNAIVKGVEPPTLSPILACLSPTPGAYSNSCPSPR